LFRIDDALDAINQKLIRRHPHVFGDQTAATEGDVRRIWREVKAQEKGGSKEKLLDGVPRSLPALVEAQQISTRAASAGFDWDNPEQVLAKLNEELAELEGARQGGDRERVEDEIGDLLFVVVNLARKLKIDAEQALRKSNGKFRRRFGSVEEGLAARGKTPQESTVAEMEELWQEAKGREPKGHEARAPLKSSH
ncbi:MAG: nucleoside triphosphate pyrophosphohydrolase, partial [Bryobacteraceae bacterium]